jgi:hypothetical protein
MIRQVHHEPCWTFSSHRPLTPAKIQKTQSQLDTSPPLFRHIPNQSKQIGYQVMQNTVAGWGTVT